MSIQEIKLKIVPLLKKAGIKKSQIFGSYARGEQTKNSDIDLIVEMPPKTSLIKFASLKNELEDALSIKVDLVSYDALNKKIEPYVQADAIKIL